LAGIGFTWLGFGQILYCFSFATIGIFALVIGVALQFGAIKTGSFPPGLVVLVIISAIGWASGTSWPGGGTMEDLNIATSQSSMVRFPIPAGPSVYATIGQVLQDDLGIVLPVAFAGSVATILNTKVAERAGDEYPLREALIFDGVTTLLSALFGSPLGTCVYIGHPAYKSFGAHISYGLMFCWFWVLCAMFGLFAAFVALIPPFAMAPILLFVGLSIVTDAFATAPDKHLPACAVGLFPAIADFIVKADFIVTSKSVSDEKPPAWWGLVSMSNGALLLCLIWTGVFVYFIDRKFGYAAGWCFGAAFCSALGIIHQSSLDLTFKKFNKASSPFPETTAGGAITQYSPMSFTVGYTVTAAFLLLMWLIQKSFPNNKYVMPPALTNSHETEEQKACPEHKLRKIMDRVVKYREYVPKHTHLVEDDKDGSNGDVQGDAAESSKS
jgi:AGZA family xanthine/uracil permease-like MFS transporter